MTKLDEMAKAALMKRMRQFPHAPRYESHSHSAGFKDGFRAAVEILCSRKDGEESEAPYWADWLEKEVELK